MAQIADANTLFGFWPKRKVDISLERLRQVLAKHKVTKALTISTTAIFYDYRRGNDETLEACKGDQVLVPVASLDPREYVHCFGEAERMLQAGVKFFRFFPDLQGWPLDFKPFHDILGALSGKGACALVPIKGYGTATALARAMEGKDLKVIMLSVSYFNLGEVISVAKGDDRYLIESRLIDSASGLETVVGELGEDRIVLGTEAPLSYPTSPIAVVMGSELSQGAKEKILGGNLLGLIGR